MIVVETVVEMHRARASMSGPVALVPTMGALHAGHEALLRAARAAGVTVVASLVGNTRFYHVRKGDTFLDLARFYGLGPEENLRPAGS